MTRQPLQILACWLVLAPWGWTAPHWTTPDKLPFGELSVLEIREEDPSQSPLPRPGYEKLGPLDLRSVEPTSDGRGWRLTVQPLSPGMAVIPPWDFGDGRQSRELRIPVLRSVPFHAPWMGVGGGQEDVIPNAPFPWGWISLLVAPMAVTGWWLWLRWMRLAPARALRQARIRFIHRWPPMAVDRRTLDEAHILGRNLLAAHFGEEARSWGVREFNDHRLECWAIWIRSLDAARFSRKAPPFPPLGELLKSLGDRP